MLAGAAGNPRARTRSWGLPLCQHFFVASIFLSSARRRQRGPTVRVRHPAAIA